MHMKAPAVSHAYKLSLSFLSAICLLTVASGAARAQIEGCDPRVMNALNAKAQAKVAYDTAVAEQIIKQPDSVLALTCFDKAAANSARVGGQIFSNEGEPDGFVPQLAPTINDALETMYLNYRGTPGSEGPPGFETGTVDYEATDITAAQGTDCTAIADLWTEIKEGNINEEVPYATFEQLATGAMPDGAGETYTLNWEMSLGQFGELGAAVEELPKPLAIPNFNGAETVCEVLARNNGGAPPGC